ncbi:MAG: hypothetical protein JW943_16360 [Deltaproteobacteria bacterium]|nr:hypothetical protein [Deltaproteobacteria bacterium]
MDPLTIVSSFATIVGLLSNYKSERRNMNEDEYTGFIEWLNEKRHDELVGYIENNQNLSISIKALLNQQNDVILAQFKKLDDMLLILASQLDGFSSIAKAVQADPIISDQALLIVKQLVESQASCFMEHKVMTGGLNEYIILGGKSVCIKYDEPQFMEDDLNRLVELGLLRIDLGGKDRKFFITRAGLRLVS